MRTTFLSPRVLGPLALVALWFATGADPPTRAAVGSEFSYQGQLTEGGSPASGTYDFQFTLYDAASGGNVVGGPLSKSAVGVSNGLFTVSLDFGAGAFSAWPRYLLVEVRLAGSGNFTALSPRQQVLAAPFAVAANWSGLQGVPAGFADGTDDNAGGDITGVTTGASSGLTGGAASGDVSLAVSFAGSGAATTAARSDHGHGRARVAIVAASGMRDYDKPEDAIANLSTWCPGASETNPCVVRMMPGLYTLTASLTIPAAVSVEGLGTGTAILRAGGFATADKGTVVMNASCRLAHLTVENTGGSGLYAIAVYASSPTQGGAELIDVQAKAYGGTAAGFANVAFYNDKNLDLNILDSTFQVTGAAGYSSAALYFKDATAKAGIKNSQIYDESSSGAGYALYIANASRASSCDVRVERSVLGGLSFSVFNDPGNSGFVPCVATSRLNQTVSGNVRCIYAYDGQFGNDDTGLGFKTCNP